jgi:diaminohydroxyphosphoribosylaminopyrimidine deaminase/5-amino-6-(5-phosphoribosylamino)uracil reductase
MRRALELAVRGRGHVEPNPMVGAVVVRHGELVGEGWHERFGGPHAEIIALQQAGERAKDGTLYVTLEPCCHHGKTPPCTQAVIASGVKRVVMAMADPFPAVAGKGLVELFDAELGVEVGCCEEQARELNRPYLTLIQKGRPYVHLKWAMTLDGKIASRTGDSQWISNESSRAIVHQLRGRMDALVVGANTVHRDDPLLTARPPGPRTPTRIVFTTKPELPSECQLLRTRTQAPVMLVAKEPGAIPGIEILASDNLCDVMTELARRRFTNILVEGGAGVLGSFLDAGLVDEVHVFIAPKLLGGAQALSSIGGIGFGKVAEALQFTKWTTQMIDSDLYINGKI